MSDRRSDLGEYDQRLEEGHLEMIERLHVLWSNTSNPVYVWRAIDHCFAIGMVRERGRTGKLPAPPWTDTFPFPNWCLGYLSITAARIDLLSERQDFRLFPQPVGDAERTAAAYKAAREQEETVTGKRAAELLPRAMGLVRAGANAFDSARSLSLKEFDDLSFEDLKERLGSAKAAMAALLEEAATDSDREPGGDALDERAMQRRLSEARKANTPPTQKIPKKKRAKPGG